MLYESRFLYSVLMKILVLHIQATLYSNTLSQYLLILVLL